MSGGEHQTAEIPIFSKKYPDLGAPNSDHALVGCAGRGFYNGENIETRDAQRAHHTEITAFVREESNHARAAGRPSSDVFLVRERIRSVCHRSTNVGSG